MIKISHDAYEGMRKHGEDTYPHECCGVLLGRFEEDGTRVVSSAERCGNMRTDSPQNRYQIDPHDLVEAHWFGCSYVITAVQNGRAVVTNSFLLMGAEDEEKHFYEEKIVLVQN